MNDKTLKKLLNLKPCLYAVNGFLRSGFHKIDPYLIEEIHIKNRGILNFANLVVQKLKLTTKICFWIYIINYEKGIPKTVLEKREDGSVVSYEFEPNPTCNIFTLKNGEVIPLICLQRLRRNILWDNSYRKNKDKEGRIKWFEILNCSRLQNGQFEVFYDESNCIEDIKKVGEESLYGETNLKYYEFVLKQPQETNEDKTNEKEFN